MQTMLRSYAPQVPGAQPQGHAPPADFAPIAPATFWEWFAKVYDPNFYVYNWQFFPITLKPLANKTLQQTLNVQVPLFVFEFRSHFWRSDTGAAPTFPYRIGLAMQSANDWTFGQWASAIITGDNGGNAMDYRFAWPREVPASTNLTVSVDNTLNAQALEGDAGVVGLEPRRRNVPLVDHNGQFVSQPGGMAWGAR